MATEAIDGLIDSSPSEWITHRTKTGERMLEALHQQCQAAGLVPHSTGLDPVACLHALFDVAVKEGLGEVVVDYVADVCSDPFLTSADPVEAHLMDGRCVQQWAQRTLHRCRARFLQALQQGLSEPSTTATVAAEVARLQGLLPVLHALVQPGQADSEDGELAEARRLLQAARVAEWAARAAAHHGGQWGHFASEAEWRLVANRRRNLSAPLPLFLQRLLHQLRDSGCDVATYPFSSLEKAIEVFLSGSTAEPSWHIKLATLVYALADAGFDISSDSIGQAFGVSASAVALWQSHFWLDDAARGGDAAESLELACCSLPSIAGPDTPFEVVEVLAARGAPDVALAVQRSRGAPAATLSQARSLLHIRLSCSLLTEAAVEAARFLGSQAAAADDSAAPALAAQLAEWAADSRQLQSLAQLPMPGSLESALLQWLQEAALQGRVPAAQLPLFLLQRGRLSDADAASASIDAAIAAGTIQEAEAVTQQRQAIMAAAWRLLPAGAQLDGGAALQPLHHLRSPMSQLQMGLQLPLVQGIHEASPPPEPFNTRPAAETGTTAAAAAGKGSGGEGWASRPRRTTRSSARAASQEAEGEQAMETEQQWDAGETAQQTPAAAARPMQSSEWEAAMGMSPEPQSTGPRTRQAAKRQRLAATRR